MNLTIGTGCAATLCLLLSYLRRCKNKQTNRPIAYILVNQVTHARLLPVESAHAFTYPTVSLLLPLKALEKNDLDLAGGWVFGYGGLYGRLTGLRPSGYLTDNENDGKFIWSKLARILEGRGYDSDALEDAWMMTMPSFLGYEGINPLTVYYCYKPEGQLWVVILEVHNTFGERHVYILEVGKGEDPTPKGFDHQWTFPRHFHVSPFNDREGFYIVSLTAPSHPPTKSRHNPSSPAPRPIVRIHYHPPDEPSSEAPGKPSIGPLKLSAIIRPVLSLPLTTPAWLFTLASSPFALLLTSPRILYQAWILHYRKRLDVFPRPEPKPATEAWDPDIAFPAGDRGGIGWQPEGPLEKYERKRVEAFLATRATETGVRVTLIPGKPSEPASDFPAHEGAEREHLKVYYLSPRIFTIIFLCPSAAHALLLGSESEKIFVPSSPELFLSVFNPSSSALHGDQQLSAGQQLRLRPIPHAVRSSSDLQIPAAHALELHSRGLSRLPRTALAISDLIVLWILLALERFEQFTFTALRARFVPGQEPWNAWERASVILECKKHPQ
ncbi:hypothetical protein GLOTRDRAFT_138622 [Gloeophyllum trabeum ATCC 11539]|uniref:DUF1365-domain-containing protein n=1 Tax=Gloeophyllum trabeum (strain ATCC 11539 / FP-39264 / Madison 617) TaxID=670483 RepID=S7Q8L3_GLOTA|nr:uncharacterized protein GLOTRDRAFT_138622 [Gloeophyllum trabeum ATCC 11539]EPQ55867.1 hypothetical protein GLOTRDRAFT_138622 [Gloeophyllum trabeum ATCC 11539]